jgi:hypothetical protein
MSTIMTKRGDGLKPDRGGADLCRDWAGGANEPSEESPCF